MSSEKRQRNRSESADGLTFLNGNSVRILTSGDDTVGRLTVIDYIDYTQGNPPPFTRHDFSEVFTVLQGRLRFQYQEEKPFDVSEGEAITVPANAPHTFWNPETSALRILLSCSPAGLDRFFRDIYAEMEKLRKKLIQHAEMIENIAALRTKHGIEETAPAPQIDD